MNVFELFIFKSLLTYIFSIFCVLILGRILSKFLKIDVKGFESYFIYGILGIVGAASIISIIYTNGQTFFLIALIIGIVCIIRKRKIETIVLSKINFRELFIIIIAGIVIFALNGFVRYNGTEYWPLFNVDKDEIFYSLITNFLNQNHIESYNVDWKLYHGKIQLLPYHYLEQWINLFYLKFINFKAIQSLIFIVTPLFQFIFFLGILSLVGGENLKLIIAVFVSLFLLYFRYPAIDMYKSFQFSFEGFLFGLKNYPIYWLVILIVGLLRKREFDKALIIFSFTPLMNYSLYPVALVIFLFYLILNRIIFHQKVEILFVILYMIVLFGIPAISYLNPGDIMIPHLGIGTAFDFYSEDTIVRIFRGLKMGIVFLTHNTLFLLFLIFVLLKFVWYYKSRIFTTEDKYKALSFILLILISALFIATTLFFIIDCAQIIDVPFRAITFVCFILVASFLINRYWKSKKWVLITVATFQVILISYSVKIHKNKYQEHPFQNYSSDYLKKIGNLVREYPNKNWVGARILAPENYKGIYDIRSIDQPEGFPFAFFTDKLTLATLNKVPYLDDKYGVYDFNYNFLVNNEYFTQFCKQKHLNPNNDTEFKEAQLQFISENDVSFLIVEKGAKVPDAILTMVKKQIIDSESGQRILLL